MENVKPTAKDVGLIAKHPVAWMLYIAIAFASIFVYRLFSTDDAAKQDCKENVAAANKRAEVAIAAKDSVQKAFIQLLVTDKIKEDNERRIRDSVINKVVGDRAKSIIKNSQK